MRKIKVNEWKTTDQEGNEKKEDLLVALDALMRSSGQNMPKGIKNFRIMGRLSRAFEDASKSGVLKLEESDYTFLKKVVEENIPAVWASSPEISEAIENFMNVKEE